MKLLFINSIAKKKFGGGEKWMITAAKGLHDRGHEIIVGGKTDSRFISAAKKAGLLIEYFNIRWDFGPINTIKIARFLKKEAIEVLICNLNKDVRVAGLGAKLVKDTVAIARHGVLLSGKKWKHKITLTKLLDGILTNAANIKQIYQSYGWFKNDFVHVIYNGVEDKSHVKPFDFSRQFINKKIIFSAGRLAEQKGYKFLLDAAAILKARRDDLVFIIAGEGRMENKLKQQVDKLNLQNTIYFWGYIKNVDPYIKGCTLFVLPSLFEGMPNAVMEAMALEKAVIATDVNGVNELVVNRKTGIIIPPKDSKKLAEEIDTLIDNIALLDAYGKEGIKRVKENFTIPMMIRNLEEYFQAKIDEKKKN